MHFLFDYKVIPNEEMQFPRRHSKCKKCWIWNVNLIAFVKTNPYTKEIDLWSKKTLKANRWAIRGGKNHMKNLIKFDRSILNATNTKMDFWMQFKTTFSIRKTEKKYLSFYVSWQNASLGVYVFVHGLCVWNWNQQNVFHQEDWISFSDQQEKFIIAWNLCFL